MDKIKTKLKGKKLRASKTGGVKYKLVIGAVAALIVLGVSVGAAVINSQPSEDIEGTTNPVENKTHDVKLDKAGFSGKVSAYVPGKGHKDMNLTAKVGEKIDAKIMEKVDESINETLMNVAGVEIGMNVNGVDVIEL